MVTIECFDRLPLGLKIASLHRHWRAQLDTAMQPLGLTQSRWAVLVHLDRLGDGATQSAIAHDLGIELPSLMRTLENLETAGLIERQRCRSDRRARSVTFTEAGRTALEQVRERVETARRCLLADVDADDLRTFERVARRIFLNTHDEPTG